jgi:Protein of unknown function (DUF3800)
LTVLRAYLDESGVHRSSSVTAIAGFVGTDDDWDDVTKQWKQRLDRWSIPDFHYDEFINRKCAWEQLEREIRDPIRKFLAASLHNSPLTPVSFVYKGKWSENIIFKLNKERLPTAYSFCFESIMIVIERIARQKYSNTSAEVMLARQDEYQDRALEIFNLYRENDKLINIIDPIIFGPAKNVTPLQCADMLAYESYQAFKNMSIDSEITPLINMLLPNGFGTENDKSHYLIYHDDVTTLIDFGIKARKFIDVR